MATKIKICPACGKEIPALASFCPECGVKLAKPDPDSIREWEDEADEREQEDAAREEEEYERNAAREEELARRRESYQKQLDRRRSNTKKMIPVIVLLILLLIAAGIYAGTRMFRSGGSSSGGEQGSISGNISGNNESADAETGNGATDTLESKTETVPEIQTTAAAESESETASETETSTMESSTQPTTTAVDTSNAKTMYVTTYLNVRDAPGNDSNVIGQISDGEPIQVLDDSGNWYKIVYNGGVAYVYSGYVVGSREEVAKRHSEEESRAEESRKAEESKKAEEESKKAKETTKDTSNYKAGTDDSSVLAKSSKKYIDDDDLDGMSSSELRLARNEIYARHGCIFKDKKLQKYFEGKSWYTPRIDVDDFDTSDLNKYEIENIKKIRERE